MHQAITQINAGLSSMRHAGTYFDEILFFSDILEINDLELSVLILHQ